MSTNSRWRSLSAHPQRRHFLRAAAIGASALLWPVAPQARATAAEAGARASAAFNPDADIIAAPDDPALWPAFRAQLAAWRREARLRLEYDGSLYRQAAFQWSSSSYACGFVMMYARAFYDPDRARYTIESLLEQARHEFGGYDSVVLWHAYPRIGVDQRNQYDFYRDMPGGLAGLRAVVDTLHSHGVRAYINYNPWDLGTRREAATDAAMLAQMVAELHADGIFLDTMKEGGAAFRAALDAIRPGVILEGEVTPPLERLEDHHASWAQWFSDSEAPGVLRHKWFERRHMQHQTQRWNADHSAELHTAWMNGTGMMVWENVFGAWVPWSARDRSLLRAMLPVQRRYSALFAGEGWTPLVPVEQRHVYASLWSDGEDDGDRGRRTRLWTLVNRATHTVDGAQLKLEALPDQRYFDLIAGRELRPRIVAGAALLDLALPPRGLGAILAIPSAAADGALAAFLREQAAVHARADHDTTRPYAPMRPRAAPAPAIRPTVPAGMIEAQYNHWTDSLAVQVRARECGLYDSNVSDAAGYRYSYDFRVTEFTRRWVFHRYAIDETPVTNGAFLQFLRASGYRPAQPENFLRPAPGPPTARPPAPPATAVNTHGATASGRAFATSARRATPRPSRPSRTAARRGGCTICAAMCGTGPRAKAPRDTRASRCCGAAAISTRAARNGMPTAACARSASPPSSC
jgi:hypothetical protein